MSTHTISLCIFVCGEGGGGVEQTIFGGVGVDENLVVFFWRGGVDMKHTHLDGLGVG